MLDEYAWINVNGGTTAGLRCSVRSGVSSKEELRLPIVSEAE